MEKTVNPRKKDGSAEKDTFGTAQSVQNAQVVPFLRAVVQANRSLHRATRVAALSWGTDGHCADGYDVVLGSDLTYFHPPPGHLDTIEGRRSYA